MSLEMQMVLGLVIGMSLFIFLITKTKIHVFLGLVICAVTIGVIGGMVPQKVIESITKGFGNALSSIGIIIGFGVMLGKLLEISGATEVMANTFIKLLGKNKEEQALTAAGFVTSLSIFCTSGFIILAPLVKGLSRKSKKSVAALGVALAGGLLMSHSMIPPAAGPIGVAGILNANIGRMMLFGTIISIPISIVVVIYSKYIGKKIYQLPNENNDGWIRPDASEQAILKDTLIQEKAKNEMAATLAIEESSKNLPSTFMAFAPILTPILLIIINNVVKALNSNNNFLGSTLAFLGSPIIALTLGLLIATLGLTKVFSKSETLNAMEEGLKASGKLMLLVGGGGALGMIIQDSGLGNYIATGISSTSIPAILLPFLISLLIRVVQGSGSVAMMTAASVTAPMVSTLNIDPVFAALSACIGGMFFSYFNDSYFWVINETIGIKDVKEQMRIWTVTSTLASITGLICLLLLNFFFA